MLKFLKSLFTSGNKTVLDKTSLAEKIVKKAKENSVRVSKKRSKKK
jgi:type III secretion system FlhB-like substrate exporter